MRLAIKLAQKGRKSSRPNPMVGCVIVKNNLIIGKGYHKKPGSNHAEVEAINDAKKRGHNLNGSDLYVNLEPCNHFGNTPPCVKYIVENKIKRVFVGATDVNPLVNNKGIKALREAGIEVTENVMHKESNLINKVFFVNIAQHRPFVTVKNATTLNGKTADRYGSSKWISSDESREYVHKNIRNQADAILTTYKTVIADNPNLNIRFGSKIKELNCIVVDKNLNIMKNTNLNIFNRQKTTLFILCKKAIKHNLKNVHLIECPIENDKIDIKYAFEYLYKNLQICHVLVEAGGSFSGYLLSQNIIDEIYQFVSSDIIYDSKAVSSFSIDQQHLIDEKINFQLESIKKIKSDILFHLLKNT